MSKKVTKAQAEKVLSAVKEMWPEADGWSHVDGPFLHPAEHEEMRPGCWSISWEGAPEDWALQAGWKLRGHVPGVFLEPMTSWSLGLYPDE